MSFDLSRHLRRWNPQKADTIRILESACLPPVYRTHVREGRFRLRVRRFLKVIGAERLAWVFEKG